MTSIPARSIDSRGVLVLRAYSAAPLEGHRTLARPPDVVVYPDGRAVADTSPYPPDLPAEWHEYQLTDDELAAVRGVVEQLARNPVDDPAELTRSDQGMTILWCTLADGRGLEFTSLGLDTRAGNLAPGTSPALAELDTLLTRIESAAAENPIADDAIEAQLPTIMVAPYDAT